MYYNSRQKIENKNNVRSKYSKIVHLILAFNGKR
jgi:hypothetical protein